MNMGITEMNVIFITINILISYQNFSVSIFIQMLSPICNLKVQNSCYVSVWSWARWNVLQLSH